MFPANAQLAVPAEEIEYANVPPAVPPDGVKVSVTEVLGPLYVVELGDAVTVKLACVALLTLTRPVTYVNE